MRMGLIFIHMVPTKVAMKRKRLTMNCHVFEQDFDIPRILEALSLRFHTEIDRHTLLLFDEIQAAPRGITSLKYFCEKAPTQPVIAAGSLRVSRK